MLQEGFLLKGNRLCVPKCSIRVLMVKEAYRGGIACHFGVDEDTHYVTRTLLLAKVVGQYTSRGFKVCNVSKGEEHVPSKLIHTLTCTGVPWGRRIHGFCGGVA